MEIYSGFKLIKAKPMDRQEYNDYRGWELPDDEDGEDDGYLVEYVDGGESNHADHDGYISWSPEAVFNRAYKESGEMSFGMAIEAAKMGRKVSRIGWNGSGMYAVIMPGFPEGVPANAQTAKVHGIKEGHSINIRSYWALKTAQNDIATWAPSGSDSLANDWCIVD